MGLASRLIVLAFAVFALTAATLPAAASQYYYRYSEREVREIGARNGYELGLRQGRRDARQGYRLDYKRDPDYKYGMVGYRPEYRHDGNYKKGFRDGFEAGYRNGYHNVRNRRNDRWDDWRRGDGRDYDDDYYDGRRPRRY
jgi:hypothetical protein